MPSFNWSVFKTRTLTAIIFALVVLTVLFWNHWAFFILFSIIQFGCWLEYIKLIQTIDHHYKNITLFHKAGVMITGWALIMFLAGEKYVIGGLSFDSIGFWLLLMFAFVFPIIEVLFARITYFKNFLYSFFGLLYISLSLGLLIYLRVHSWPEDKVSLYGVVLPAGIIFSIWINDTMAYMVGSFMGKTPFYPHISPKKTWEGTVGGAILCVATISLLGHYLGYFQWFDWLFISLLGAISGTLGDLYESKLKRKAGVKDSGTIMPGHGGFLDRFDSLLFAIPAVFLYWLFFMK